MTISVNPTPATASPLRHLAATGLNLQKSLERLASGLRINRAADDAAGMAIGKKLETQIRGSAQALDNSQFAVNYARTAEGGLALMAGMMQRMRELVIQAANDTNVQSDRAKIQLEIDQLLAEIDHTAVATEFNGIKPLQIPPERLQELTRPKTGPADISFIVDTSGTMGPFIANVQANLNQFLTDLTAAGIDFRISVTAMADNLNGGNPGQPLFDAIDDTNTILDSTSDPTAIADALGSLVASGALVDPYNSMLEVGIAARDTAGEDAIPRSPGPAPDAVTGRDAVTRRAGVRYFQIVVTDTFPEETTGTIGGAAAGAAREAAVAAELAANGVTVFGVIDPAENSNYDGITSATGGQLFDINNPGFSADLQAIVQAISSAVAQPGELIVDKGAIQVQVGANEGQLIGFDRPHITYDALGLVKIDVDDTGANFDGMLGQIDAALEKVASLRTHFGTIENRLQYTQASLGIAQENMAEAHSRIMDTDFAQETAELTRAQILQQAGVATLSQAQVIPQTVLSLLG